MNTPNTKDDQNKLSIEQKEMKLVEKRLKNWDIPPKVTWPTSRLLQEEEETPSPTNVSRR